MFDMKFFRENILKKSYEELSTILGISIHNIKELENDNVKANSNEIIDLICDKMGYLKSELNMFNVDYKEDDTYMFKTNEDYSKVEDIKLNINKIIKWTKNYSYIHPLKNEPLKIFNSMINSFRKPTVSFIGNSDCGKSSMINFMLGKQISPSQLRPATSSLLRIVHIDDRPDKISKHNVYILSRATASFGYDNIENYILDYGDYDIIEKYGIHGNLNQGISEVLIFVDSPLLKLCDIWDLPGLESSANQKDDNITNKYKFKSDITFILSTLDEFLNKNESILLCDIINVLKNREKNLFLNNGTYKYNNLFVIATKIDSQCTNIPGTNRYRIDKDAIYKVKKMGVEDAIRTKIPESIITDTMLNDRTFGFTIKKDNNIYDEFREHLYKKLNESLLIFRENMINDIVDSHKSQLKFFFQNMLNELNRCEDILNKISFWESDEYISYINKMDNIVNQQIQNITNRHKSLTSHKINDYLSNINVEFIVKLINEKKIKKKKKDLANFVDNYLINRINLDIKNIILDVTNNYKNEIYNMFNNIKIDNSIPDFKALRGFMIGYSGLLQNKKIKDSLVGVAGSAATLGALSVLASSAGNLGGYILVTQSVGLLSTIGVDFTVFGGTAGVVALTSAIGGPIVWGIIIASVVGMSIFGILNSNGWKTKLAKDIIKGINNSTEWKNKVIYSFDEYWNNTISSFPKNNIYLEHINKVNKYKYYNENNINMLEDKIYIEEFIKNVSYMLDSIL